MSTATSDAERPEAGDPTPLRIAVPNKGALSDAAATMLHEAGYRVRRDRKELVVVDQAAGVELFYLRPRDIAVYVGAGTVDCGITGRDLLIDSASTAVEVMGLGFGRSTFRWAARPGTASTIDDLAGKRIATSYARLVRDHLLQSGVDAADVVRLDGAVETAITLGVADVIADVVETGATLRSQGLEPFGEPIMRSEAVLIAAEGARPVATEVLERRLRGVVTARNYVLMDYDVPNDVAEAAMAITPGLESPTVSPLQDRDWSAIRAMVPRSDTNALMDELYALGARAILITDIAACRL